MSKTRFEDFLQFAIKNEQSAALLYEKYASLINLPVQKNMLEVMASVERTHEIKLKAILQGNTSTLLGQDECPDLHIADFTVDCILTSESSLEDVFIFAIKSEQKAFELYDVLSKLEEDPATKDLLEKLASEEKKHKFDLENEYEKNFIKEN